MDQVFPERLYAFAPDAERAGFIDWRVRQNLAASLAAIFDQVGVAFDISSDRSASLVATIKAGPISPRVVATYADLVEAIYRDQIERARLLTHALVETPAAHGSALQILNLSDEALGDGQVARYVRHAFEDGQTPTLAPMSNDRLARLVSMVNEVFDLLDVASPELSSEIRELMRQVVFVHGGDGFGGATSFYLWGAMVLNATTLDDRVALATAIIHEAAHSFLFGVNLGARLTENEAEDVCASPLRIEPRPVEGVFHATFVLARMIYGLDHMLRSGALTPEETEHAEASVRQSVQDFGAGVQSLAIAKFTSAGARLLETARRYVDGRAGVLVADRSGRHGGQRRRPVRPASQLRP